MVIEGLTRVIQDEFRVVAEVDTFLIKDKPDELTRRANELEAEIKRHCDSYEHVYWEHKAREVCIFCEEEWKGCVDDNGYPCCCGQAQEKAEELGIEAAPEKPSDAEKVRKLVKALQATADSLADDDLIALGDPANSKLDKIAHIVGNALAEAKKS